MMVPIVGEECTQRGVFCQHFFRPTMTAFEGFKFPLNAKDTIFLLMFLLSLFNTVYSAFKDRMRLLQNLPQRLGMLPRNLLQRLWTLPSSTICSHKERWIAQP